jgi:hypothetical protein
MHIVGHDGVALAKNWLEATGRFQVSLACRSGRCGAVALSRAVGRDKESFDALATHLDTTRATRGVSFVREGRELLD